MAEQTVTIVLPSGGARTAEIPADLPARELIIELVSMLELPTVGPDGRPWATVSIAKRWDGNFRRRRRLRKQVSR